MEEHIVRILDIKPVTHDVRRFRVEKPTGYNFIPGQATELSVNKPDWKEEKRPFTFTSLNSEPFLEFTIKIYPARKGVTNELGSLVVGDEVIIRDVWGAINYKGKGVFIAGGAGITPFISIFRDLHSRNELQGNKLLFANKTTADIILKDELSEMLGNNLVNILSEESVPGHSSGFITEDFLKSNIDNYDQFFYVCGPDPMIEMVLKLLASLGASDKSVVVEI
ncbi:MAG: FAD-binding oxidoreductase [Chloroflexota bacterium]